MLVEQGLQTQTDLDIRAFILAQGAVQNVGQRYNSAPLWQRPDMNRAILTTSKETWREFMSHLEKNI